MKKYVSIILAVVLAFASVVSLSGCSKSKNGPFEIVLITDGGSIDDKGYNQDTWNGVKAFADDNNYSCKYYQPSLNDNGKLDSETVDKYVKLATDNGAKFVVVQGNEYSSILSEIAPKYATVNFLLLGSERAVRLTNVMTITFDVLQAGFLAGYASVAMGNTRIGYIGSVSDSESKLYGSGFVQGVGYCSDEKNIPTILDYANYDADNLNFDYSFTISPKYIKVSECKEDTFKVNVIDGLGTGVYADGENVSIIANPAPSGKVFDHWEVKSDTEGVKDKKVNISSDKTSPMNLLVGDCDCTITAVYADAETCAITVSKKTDVRNALNFNKKETLVKCGTYNSVKDSTYSLRAPAADKGYVFDHWECKEDVIKDINDSFAEISVTDHDLSVVAVYRLAENPTFDVIVENGTGSGSYELNDYVEVVADPPQDGYMFDKWVNNDSQGLSTGILMENEYSYNTSFSMIDRFASLAKSFYNEGVSVIFGGGNSQSESIFTAASDYRYGVHGFGWGTDRGGNNCLASVVTDYKQATYNSLSAFGGGQVYIGDCSNSCLYVTGMNIEPTHKDKDGNDIANDDYNEGYATVYKGLSDGSVKIDRMFANDKTFGNTKCMTLNYKIK